MGYDDRTHFSHVFVPTRVIPVPVRVDEELHVTFRQRLDGSEDFFGQRRELIVDQERTVVSYGKPQIPPGSNKHIHVTRNVYRLDLNLVRVLPRERRMYGKYEEYCAA